MEEYVSNSLRSKENKTDANQPQKPNIAPVTKSQPKIRKKKGIEKILDAFMPNDISAYKRDLVEKTIVPYIKRMISDSVNKFFDLEPSSSTRKTGILPSYGEYYDYRRKENQPVRHTAFSFEELSYNTLFDADSVLTSMRHLIEIEGKCTVLQYYDLSRHDNPNGSTAEKFGWRDLRFASVTGNKEDGYYIKLPRAIAL